MNLDNSIRRIYVLIKIMSLYVLSRNCVTSKPNDTV